MDIFSSLEIAFNSIVHNRMRSILTGLGIIIGVAAVIAMLSIGRGATLSIKKSLATMGDNLLTIFPGSMAMHGVREAAGTRTSLTAEDAQAIKEECPSVSLVSPMVNASAQIIYENQNWATRINGVGTDFFLIRSWGLTSGAAFTEYDVRAAAKVCLLGKVVAENLFKDVDPMGKIVRINRIPFRVSGILEEKGAGLGGDQDDIVIMPYTTVQKRLRGINYVNNIQVSALSAEAVYRAEEEIRKVLIRRHRIAEGKEEDFTVRNMAEMLKAGTAIITTISLLLGGVASISLVVGGIGIMNIMLVSVTERTREIGIRMAVGAKQGDILLQFLVESLMLSLTGGIIGIGAGISISLIISALTRWPISISPGSIALAFCFAAGVGIFFGYYPARRAANLNPIQALRYE